MDLVIYYLVLGLVRLLQFLPLGLVAWLGRRCGALAYLIDARHRRVATENLTQAFGSEKTPDEIRALAREHFRRLGENYASAIKTSSMSPTELEKHVQFVGIRRLAPASELEVPRSCIAAIGHFGNFELYACTGHFMPPYKTVTTYRGLRQPLLNQLLLSLRRQTGCLYFERRTDAEALRKVMTQPGTMIGLLCDQHAGRSGLAIPFFGRACSTNAAPAVLALRYKLPLFTALCFRVGLARWRIEIGDDIPTRVNGRRRTAEEIMTDVNAALENAVRRDPANWFWVHRRWKTLAPKSKTPPAGEPTSHA